MIPDYMPAVHPLLVHFPIVLLVVAVVLDVGALLARSARLREAATWMLVAGTLTLPLTYWTGTLASDRVASPFPRTVGAMAEHADHAWITLWFFVTLAGVRLGIRWLSSLDGWRHGILVLAGLVGTFFVWETAEHGGRLVYDLGAGVRPVREAPEGAFEPEPEPDPAELGPRTEPDGTWTWSFRPGAEAVVDRFLRPLRGELPAASTEVRRTALVLDLGDGAPRRLLTFGDELADASVRARIDPSRASGPVGLVVRASDTDHHEFLLLADGEIRLGVRRGGEDRVLAREALEPDTEWLELELVAAGEHLRGYVDGQMVVHGHADPASAGPAGLRLAAGGSLRLEALRIRPVTE